MASNVLSRLKLRKNNYFLVSVHREENVDNEKFLGNSGVSHALSEKYNRP